MRRMTATRTGLLAAILLAGCAGDGPGALGEVLRGIGAPVGPSDARVAEGLREALRVGTGNAVALTGRPGGYLGNPAIRIPLPDGLEDLARSLRRVGLGREVDRFVASMNRAAERAAPEARAIFLEAVSGITFEDARRILGGGDTAATDLFRARTSERLYAAFRPIVGRALGEVGATRRYRALVAQYRRLPLAVSPTVDLDHHVTARALDGLFLVLAGEERRIRTDPAARVTELLREVFGGRARRAGW